MNSNVEEQSRHFGKCNVEQKTIWKILVDTSKLDLRLIGVQTFLYPEVPLFWPQTEPCSTAREAARNTDVLYYSL